MFSSFPSFLTKIGTSALLLSLVLTSCKKDNESTTPSYTVPTTYNFTNVNYAGQSARLQMLDELIEYIEEARDGQALSAQKMKDMFANANNPFGEAALNTSGKQLKDKTYPDAVAGIESYFDVIAAASQSTLPASNGVAGVAISKDGSRKYHLDANGFDTGEVVEKSLMGSAFYYQATAVYLSEDNIGDAVNNTLVALGEGTAMEHHWDEAFGYTGLPKDYSAATAKESLSFWAEYLGNQNAKLGTADQVFQAFLKGRAAISNKDMKTKKEQIAVIQAAWEKASVASAIGYLNRAKTNIADDAIRNHVLTEAVGFVKALRYNPNKKITNAQIEQVLTLIGNNLYQVKVANLDQARDLLANTYGLTSMKETL